MQPTENACNLRGAMSQGNATKCRRRRQGGTPIRTPPDAGREYARGLLSVLRHWKARSRLSQPHHFVTTTRTGRPLEHRQAARRLASVVKRAGLDIDGLPRVTPPQLRYSFGSILIDAGEATSRVSRLMGHANGAITGQVYADEIERRDNSERTRATMRAAFGTERLGPAQFPERRRREPGGRPASSVDHMFV
jgi:integrase